MNKVLDLRRTKLSAAKKFFKASPVVMIAAGLVVAGVASAALVSYLANDVTVHNTVSSPVKMSVNLGVDCAESGNTWLTISSFGGDEFIYSTVGYNQANNDVDGYNVTVNEQIAGGNLTGEECTEIYIPNPSGSDFEILDDIYVVCSGGALKKLVDYTWDSPKLVTTVCYPSILGCGNCSNVDQACLSTIEPGSSNIQCITTRLELHQANKGTYRIKGQFVDDLKGYAVEQYGAGVNPCSLATPK